MWETKGNERLRKSHLGQIQIPEAGPNKSGRSDTSKLEVSLQKLPVGNPQGSERSRRYSRLVKTLVPLSDEQRRAWSKTRTIAGPTGGFSSEHAATLAKYEEALRLQEIAFKNNQFSGRPLRTRVMKQRQGDISKMKKGQSIMKGHWTTSSNPSGHWACQTVYWDKLA